MLIVFSGQDALHCPFELNLTLRFINIFAMKDGRSETISHHEGDAKEVEEETPGLGGPAEKALVRKLDHIIPLVMGQILTSF